jgi:biotin carboxyl carrier protein
MTTLRLRLGHEIREIRVEADAAYIDGRRVAFERVDRDGVLAAIRLDGREHEVVTAAGGNRVFAWADGFAGEFERVSASRPAHARDASGDLISPMPGRVRRILVENGAHAATGDVLLVLEAMKMEHAIRSPRDGRVRLHVGEGELVEAGVELAEVE